MWCVYLIGFPDMHTLRKAVWRFGRSDSNRQNRFKAVWRFFTFLFSGSPYATVLKCMGHAVHVLRVPSAEIVYWIYLNISTCEWWGKPCGLELEDPVCKPSLPKRTVFDFLVLCSGKQVAALFVVCVILDIYEV
eukprot:XP_025979400.1 uncharacterized protein LOC112997720 [Glycine max]